MEGERQDGGQRTKLKMKKLKLNYKIKLKDIKRKL
tara:strand:- start:432 stop:536 length:105 start_codon:yes stop_codon:yes gene_type:complete